MSEKAKIAAIQNGVRLIFFGAVLLLRKYFGFEIAVLVYLALIWSDQK